MAAITQYTTNREALEREGIKYDSPLDAYFKLTYSGSASDPDTIASFVNSGYGSMSRDARLSYRSDPSLMQQALQKAGIDTDQGWEAFLNASPLAKPAPASGVTAQMRATDPTLNPLYGLAESKMVNGQRVDISTGQPYSGPTPTRAPGQSIEDFTRSLDPKFYQMTPEEANGGAAGIQAWYTRTGTPRGSGVGSGVGSGGVLGASTALGTTPPVSPAVGTSTALRMKEKAQALKDAFGLGNAPVMPDIFGSTDQKSLNLARQERDAINKELENILAERLAIDAEFRKFKQNAGEGTTEAGRAGITSEEGRKVQEQYDALNRRELVLETKLNNRNAVIKELMSSQQQEYAMAVDQYNTRFSQALQLYEIFDREEEREYDRQRDERDELRTNAKANLQVLSQSLQAQIEAGTLSEINAVQRAQLQDLETQAGLPLGSTLAVLQTLKPGEEKLWVGVDDFGGFSYITKTANGEIKVYKSENAVPQEGSSDDEEKIVAKFQADLANINLVKAAGTREQFIRQLQSKYPEIDGDDIATAVYSTYPNGYDKAFNSRSL